MDLKERICALMDRLYELEEEKRLLIEEVGDTVEFAEPEELTQDFIDFFYWETDFPLTSFSKLIGPNFVSKLITPGKTIELPCPICGKSLSYEVTSRDNRNKLTLEHRKRINNHRRSQYLDYVCPECIADYKEKIRNSNEYKEDQEAAKRVRDYGKNINLATMPYGDFLQTTYWKKFATYARRESGFACQECGVTGVRLNVHHLTYERRGRERISDVEVLCPWCHAKRHGKDIRWVRG